MSLVSAGVVPESPVQPVQQDVWNSKSFCRPCDVCGDFAFDRNVCYWRHIFYSDLLDYRRRIFVFAIFYFHSGVCAARLLHLVRGVCARIHPFVCNRIVFTIINLPTSDFR